MLWEGFKGEKKEAADVSVRSALVYVRVFSAEEETIITTSLKPRNADEAGEAIGKSHLVLAALGKKSWMQEETEERLSSPVDQIDVDACRSLPDADASSAVSPGSLRPKGAMDEQKRNPGLRGAYLSALET